MKAFQFKVTELTHVGRGLRDPTGVTGPRGDTTIQATGQYFFSTYRYQNSMDPQIHLLCLGKSATRIPSRCHILFLLSMGITNIYRFCLALNTLWKVNWWKSKRTEQEENSKF